MYTIVALRTTNICDRNTLATGAPNRNGLLFVCAVRLLIHYAPEPHSLTTMNQLQYNNGMQQQPVPFRLPLPLRHSNIRYFDGVPGAPKADRMQYRPHRQGNLPPKKLFDQ